MVVTGLRPVYKGGSIHVPPQHQRVYTHASVTGRVWTGSDAQRSFSGLSVRSKGERHRTYYGARCAYSYLWIPATDCQGLTKLWSWIKPFEISEESFKPKEVVLHSHSHSYPNSVTTLPYYIFRATAQSPSRVTTQLRRATAPKCI
jgi:hypothetical protein